MAESGLSLMWCPAVDTADSWQDRPGSWPHMLFADMGQRLPKEVLVVPLGQRRKGEVAPHGCLCSGIAVLKGTSFYPMALDTHTAVTAMLPPHFLTEGKRKLPYSVKEVGHLAQESIYV